MQKINSLEKEIGENMVRAINEILEVAWNHGIEIRELKILENEVRIGTLKGDRIIRIRPLKNATRVTTDFGSVKIIHAG